MASLLLLVQLATALFMTGVMWVIQIVHYPLFARVGTEQFIQYVRDHSMLITWVVMPPMLIELGTACLMVLLPVSKIPLWVSWSGLALVLIIWLSTFFLQVLQHATLTSGFDPAAHQLLVSSNWLRTIAWTLRSGLLLWAVSKLITL